MKILIVEDDFSGRILLQGFLSGFGASDVAVTGNEAVQAVRIALDAGEHYDLICMDIMMPEMCGQQALAEIRAMEEARGLTSTFGAKIIMCTALSHPQNVFTDSDTIIAKEMQGVFSGRDLLFLQGESEKIFSGDSRHAAIEQAISLFRENDEGFRYTMGRSILTGSWHFCAVGEKGTIVSLPRQ